MIKKKTVLIFTLCLAIILSISYVCLSVRWANKSLEFYVVQVGAFSSKENADKLIDQLSNLQKDTYTYEKEGLIYVLTCISNDQKEIEEEMKWLNENNINNAKRTYIYDGDQNLQSLDKNSLIEYLQQ